MVGGGDFFEIKIFIIIIIIKVFVLYGDWELIENKVCKLFCINLVMIIV